MDNRVLFITILGLFIILSSIYYYPMSQAAVDFNNDIFKQTGMELPTTVQRSYDQAPLISLLTNTAIGISLIVIAWLLDVKLKIR
jgi:hypothetical protein